jgi:hypothetical protein
MPAAIRLLSVLLATAIAACVSHPADETRVIAPGPEETTAPRVYAPQQGFSPQVTEQARLNHRLRLLLHTLWRKYFQQARESLHYLTQTLDLDNDGDEDLIISYSLNPQGTPVTYRIIETLILRNLGQDFQVESAGSKVQLNDATVADFNADGLQDIFVADTGLDAEPFPGAQSRLLLQTTDGRLDDVTRWNVPKLIAHTNAVCSGDYDADGDQDLFLAIVNNEHVLWENDGNGKFSDATLTILPAELNGNGEDPVLSFQQCATADFNNDGRDDLVLGQQDIGRPEHYIRDNDLFVLRDSHVVLYGDPQGRLKINYSIGLLPVEWDRAGDRPQVTDIQAADFDQDDCIDLLVSSSDDGAQSRTNFAVYFGDCTGGFSAAVDYTISPSLKPAHVLHVTDFNRDGFPDFVPHYLSDPNPDGGPEPDPVDFRYYEPRAYLFTKSLQDPFAPRPLWLREIEQLPLRPFHGLYHSELPGYTGITR